MTDEAKECRNAYRREYYKNNKDKMKEWRKKYYEKNKEKILKTNAKYYEKNKEKVLKTNAKYRKKVGVLGFCVRLEGESSEKFLRLLEIKRKSRSQFIREAIEKYIKENENILTDRTLNIIERLKGEGRWM